MLFFKIRSKGHKGLLIFISVLKEMVFQSFDLQLFDYLLKTIKDDDLGNSHDAGIVEKWL